MDQLAQSSFWFTSTMRMVLLFGQKASCVFVALKADAVMEDSQMVVFFFACAIFAFGRSTTLTNWCKGAMRTTTLSHIHDSRVSFIASAFGSLVFLLFKSESFLHVGCP